MTVRGKVLRKRGSPLGTPGRMTLQNGFSSDTLEKEWANNESGKSCTAPGVDKGRVWWSPGLKRLVILFEDRNGRKLCEVHHGNHAGREADLDGDGVPEVTNVHGCTLVGSGFGPVERKSDKKPQWGIKFSGSTLAALIDSLKIDGATDHSLDEHGFARGYHDVEIEYAWAPGEDPREEPESIA